ncbi:methyltransferase domain-containing protein, partial [uncultured Microbulbifer sp.]|uniref:class I SAM-dependent methyltransferase n=1 Tax=uncultured Microbulbifer sp. TaxID=348147 RepID=UPI0025F97D1D
MADAVTTEEREKYQTMWADPRYSERSPGMRFLDDALTQLNMPMGASVIDLGCGTGRVAAELKAQGFDVTALDIADNAGAEFDGEFI